MQRDFTPHDLHFILSKRFDVNCVICVHDTSICIFCSAICCYTHISPFFMKESNWLIKLFNSTIVICLSFLDRRR